MISSFELPQIQSSASHHKSRRPRGLSQRGSGSQSQKQHSRRSKKEVSARRGGQPQERVHSVSPMPPPDVAGMSPRSGGRRPQRPSVPVRIGRRGGKAAGRRGGARKKKKSAMAQVQQEPPRALSAQGKATLGVQEDDTLVVHSAKPAATPTSDLGDGQISIMLDQQLVQDAAPSEPEPASKSVDPLRPTDKVSTCLELLVDGNVDSFVDFFYLTHRTDLTGEAVELPEEPLQFISENLRAAEQAQRAGQNADAFEAFEKLGHYFYEATDFKTAVYFFEKCLEAAEATDDAKRQAKSNLNLGLTLDHMGDSEGAIVYHEQNLKLARKIANKAMIEDAELHLIDGYKKLGEALMAREDFERAIEFFDKALRCSSDAGDLRNEGIATHRVGEAHLRSGNVEKAIRFQTRYLEICQQLGDQLGEGAACAALAEAERMLGNDKAAVKHLENYLNVATINNQSAAQVEACAALGEIFSAKGDYKKAVHYFDKMFQTAKSMRDRKWIETARVKLGVARGNRTMSSFMDVVATDLDSLLKWKTRRASFKST